MEQQILNKLSTWTKDIDKELSYDNISLWTFYKQMFLTNNFPNKYLKYSLSNLKNKIENKKIENKPLISFITRKAILINEKIKLKIRQRHKLQKNMEKKVLFFVQADKVVDNKILKIGNLIEKTKQLGIPTYLLSYEPFEKNTGNQLLKQDHMIYEYIDKNLLDIVKINTKKLNQSWKNIPESKKIELLTIENNSIYPYIKNELDFLFSKEFLTIVLTYHEAHKKLLKEENIKLICTQGAGTLYPKTLFSAAKTLKIPTLIMQHGICFSHLETNLLDKTIFAVFGKKSKEELSLWNISKENIKITGASIFDETINYINKSPEEETITLMTSGFYIYGLVPEKEYFQYIQNWLQQIQEELPDKKILIKLHPEEKNHIHKYEKLANQYQNIKVTAIVGKEHLYNFMINSSVIINFASTVALEAMILNKPVITISDLHNSPIVEFDLVIKRILGSGASINPSKNENIGKIIKEILTNKELQTKLKKARIKFVRDSCYKIDGKSSERIVSLIQEIIKSKTSLT